MALAANVQKTINMILRRRNAFSDVLKMRSWSVEFVRAWQVITELKVDVDGVPLEQCIILS